MLKNEGTKERLIQLGVSVVAAIAAIFWAKGGWRIGLGLFALLPAYFSAKSFCPFYWLIGKNNASENKQ